MSESGSDTRSGIGARLRAGRERMGLTLLQAAEKLHVDPKVVECLEAERFDALGAPVFVKGHLKHYAELTGEQAAQLIEIYNASTKPALPDLTRLPKAAPDTAPGRLAVPSLIVLIGFVLVGVVWWFIESMPAASDAEAVASADAEPTETEIQMVPESVPLPLPLPDPEQVSPATAADGASSSSAGGPGAAAPSAATAARSGSSSASAAGAPQGGASAPNAGASGTGAAGAGGAAATPAAAPARPMEVKLRFAADSWVEIYDSKGERLFADVGTADSERTVRGTPPFRVTFGNAPGVSFDVNGTPAALPANVVRNEVAQFTINRSGRIVRARPQADGG